MTITTNKRQATKTTHILMELSVPPHRIGYLQLTLAIPLFKKDKQQSMATDLYPTIAAHLGYPDWRAVEHAIRDVIVYAWEHRNQKTWDKYFPNCTEIPSNKRFIATIAEYI